MKKGMIIAATALLAASCGYPGDIVRPLYKEALYEGFTPGEYVALYGNGITRIKAILNVEGDHEDEPAVLTMTLYDKDPVTEEWITEPASVLKGTMSHRGFSKYKSHSGWDYIYHVEEIVFSSVEGDTLIEPEALSGVVELFPDTVYSIDRSEDPYTHWWFPGRGTRITVKNIRERQPSILEDFSDWVRL